MAKKRQRPQESSSDDFEFEGFDSSEAKIPGPGPRSMSDYDQEIPSPGPGRNYRPPRGIASDDSGEARPVRGRGRRRAPQTDSYDTPPVRHDNDDYDNRESRSDSRSDSRNESTRGDSRGDSRGRGSRSSNYDDAPASSDSYGSYDDNYENYNDDRGYDAPQQDYESRPDSGRNDGNNGNNSNNGGRGRRAPRSENGGNGGGYRGRSGGGNNNGGNGGGNRNSGGGRGGAPARGRSGGQNRNTNSQGSGNRGRSGGGGGRPGPGPRPTGARPGGRPAGTGPRGGGGGGRGRGGYRSNTGYQNRQNENFAPFENQSEDGTVELHEETGMLEMHPNGYGFLRKSENNYSRQRTDPFVPGTMIERFGLREGLVIRGMVRPGRGQTGPRVKDILDVDGMEPDAYLEVKSFDTLTPINPNEWYNLEVGPKPLTNRVIDLLTPMGKGQRALIVAPPRSGKTILLQHISEGIAKNHPDTKLIVLLIDERPEEVTDMKRNVDGEVIASSLDEDIESHVRLSQLVIERCKRLAEMGKDVFLLMDSITRLARAFNKWVGSTGRGGATMTGGVDIKAMDIPKKLFATARAFEEGGSVTIAGTALIDTDSRMDELIFQEFKGTGNMELVLDRKLAERRVWPAVDISKSGTRREELLLPESTLDAVTALRRTLTQMNPIEAMEQLTKQLTRFDSNSEFVKLISGKMMAE